MEPASLPAVVPPSPRCNCTFDRMRRKDLGSGSGAVFEDWEIERGKFGLGLSFRSPRVGRRVWEVDRAERGVWIGKLAAAGGGGRPETEGRHGEKVFLVVEGKEKYDG